MNRKEQNGKGKNEYVFQLYVTGASPNSIRAIANIKLFCEKYLKKNYDLDIIDVYKEAIITVRENIVALPLLIKKHPLPEKRLVGDMSNMEKLIKSVGLPKGNT